MNKYSIPDTAQNCYTYVKVQNLRLIEGFYTARAADRIYGHMMDACGGNHGENGMSLPARKGQCNSCLRRHSKGVHYNDP